jgi:hypothetical protein
MLFEPDEAFDGVLAGEAGRGASRCSWTRWIRFDVTPV